MMFSRISPFWRGHLFLFDTPKPIMHSSHTGNRLLLILLFMEALVRPVLLFGSRSLAITELTWWLLSYMLLLLALAFWLVGIFTRVSRSQLGLYPWMQWSKTEKLYFLQGIPIGIVVFSYFSFNKLEVLSTHPSLLKIVATNFLPEMMWGFYQEFTYRGLLQAELVDCNV